MKTRSVTNWFDSLQRVIATGDGAANRWIFYNSLGLITTISNAYGAAQPRHLAPT